MAVFSRLQVHGKKALAENEGVNCYASKWKSNGRGHYRRATRIVTMYCVTAEGQLQLLIVTVATKATEPPSF